MTVLINIKDHNIDHNGLNSNIKKIIIITLTTLCGLFVYTGVKHTAFFHVNKISMNSRYGKHM